MEHSTTSTNDVCKAQILISVTLYYCFCYKETLRLNMDVHEYMCIGIVVYYYRFIFHFIHLSLTLQLLLVNTMCKECDGSVLFFSMGLTNKSRWDLHQLHPVEQGNYQVKNLYLLISLWSLSCTTGIAREVWWSAQHPSQMKS